MNHRHPEGDPPGPLMNKAAGYANPLILAAVITMFLVLSQRDRANTQSGLPAAPSISTLTADEKWLAVE